MRQWRIGAQSLYFLAVMLQGGAAIVQSPRFKATGSDDQTIYTLNQTTRTAVAPAAQARLSGAYQVAPRIRMVLSCQYYATGTLSLRKTRETDTAEPSSGNLTENSNLAFERRIRTVSTRISAVSLSLGVAVRL